MDNVVVYHRDDVGTMDIIFPCSNVYVPLSVEGTATPQDLLAIDPPTPELESQWMENMGLRRATLQEIISKDVPPNKEHHIISRSDLPADPWFRSAWRHKNDGVVDVPIDLAREAHRNKLRILRSYQFADLDLQSMRAMERGDSQKLQEVNSRKQALRDVTAHPDIDAAQTLEELKLAGMDVIEEEE